MEATERKILKKFSAQLRIDQLEMFKQRGMGHIGGCLSVTELISVLYGKQMKYDPDNPDWCGGDNPCHAFDLAYSPDVVSQYISAVFTVG